MRLRLGIIAAALVSLAVVAAQDVQQGVQLALEDPWLERLADDGREVRLADISGLGCAECHEQITEEWRSSTHATAWQDRHYQKELRKIRRKPKCLGCHAPPLMAPLAFPAHPDAREDNRHLGVECKTCHLAGDGETILGPFGLETSAHPTEKSDWLARGGDSAACIACHATTIGPVIGLAQDFVKAELAELGLTCVECHMPSLRGPIANDPAGMQDYPARSRRSHRLNTPRDPEFLASAFGLEVEQTDAGAVLHLDNRTGHRVPGTTRRELTFELRLLDRHGDVLVSIDHVIDHRRFLPVEETLEILLKDQGVKLTVVGKHHTDGMRRPQVFLRREFDLE